jgi:hypothetical protein
MPNFTISSDSGLIVAIAVCVMVAIIWIVQFASLMSLEESKFPGQHTRIGWVVAFVFLWGIAPFAFIVWRDGLEPKTRKQGRRRRKRRRASSSRSAPETEDE